MAARGTPIVGLRVPPELRAEIEAAIESANQSRHEEPYTLTTWILSAIRERLDKPARRERAVEKKRAAQKGSGK